MSETMGARVWTVYAAGQVRRWHTNGYVVRQQDVASHSHGVATWISILRPEASARLLRAALHHDLPEVVTGDVPRYVKQAEPDIRAILDRAERAFILRVGGLQGEDGLDADEVRWLHACDLLDAWLFLLQNIIAGNEMMRGDFLRATREMRRRDEAREYPRAVRNAMEEVLALYPLVKVW